MKHRMKNWEQFQNESVNNLPKVTQWFEKPHNLKYIKLKYPFHLVVNDVDCVNTIKEKYDNIEVIKKVNKRVKQPITYNILIEKWNLQDLKDILLECYDNLVEYGFITERQLQVYKD